MKFVFKCTDTHFCSFLEGVQFELLDHEKWVSLLGNAKQFSKVVVYQFLFQLLVFKSSNCSTSLTNNTQYQIVYLILVNLMDMYWHMLLISLITNGVNTFSYLGHLDFIFLEVPLKYSTHFSIEMCVCFQSWSSECELLAGCCNYGTFSYLVVSFGEKQFFVLMQICLSLFLYGQCFFLLRIFPYPKVIEILGLYFQNCFHIFTFRGVMRLKLILCVVQGI